VLRGKALAFDLALELQHSCFVVPPWDSLLLIFRRVPSSPSWLKLFALDFVYVFCFMFYFFALDLVFFCFISSLDLQHICFVFKILAFSYLCFLMIFFVPSCLGG